MQSCRELWGDVEAVAVAVLSDVRGLALGECERLRGGESLSSEAMAVEDAGSAKAQEQDRLKALGAGVANLEKARGGKPDVAIDEVLRQKRLERQELKDQMQSASRPRHS